MSRNSRLKCVKGVVSEFTRDILKSYLLDERAATDGIQIRINGVVTVMRLRMGAILADEEELNAIAFTKGASGLLPCLLCSVTNKLCATDRDNGILAMAEYDTSIPDLACADLAKCCVRTNEDIWKACDDLALLPKGQVAEREHTT